MEKIKIGIADDNKEFCEILTDYFKEKDNLDIVFVTHDGVKTVDAIKEKEIDILVLDLVMPYMDGLGVLETINSMELDVYPKTIVLSAVGQETITQKTINLGAEYYMVKPFDPKELLARVKAVTRRYSIDCKARDIIKYADLTIDIGAYEVTYKGSLVKLAPKELELLHFMANNPNKVFTREQLMYEVWGYDYPGDSRTVDVHIKRLREKVKNGENWDLQTVWGVGYKFEVR